MPPTGRPEPTDRPAPGSPAGAAVGRLAAETRRGSERCRRRGRASGGSSLACRLAPDPVHFTSPPGLVLGTGFHYTARECPAGSGAPAPARTLRGHVRRQSLRHGSANVFQGPSGVTGPPSSQGTHRCRSRRQSGARTPKSCHLGSDRQTHRSYPGSRCHACSAIAGG
jgi:hypothetical protein